MMPPDYTQGSEVLALHSFIDDCTALAVVSVSKEGTGFADTLDLLLLSPDVKRRLRRIRGPQISGKSVRGFFFSQDGSKLFATSRDENVGGWIVVLCSTCSLKLPDLYYVLKVPRLPRLLPATSEADYPLEFPPVSTSKAEREISDNYEYVMHEPRFASKDTIVIRAARSSMLKGQRFIVFQRFSCNRVVVRFNTERAWVEPELWDEWTAPTLESVLTSERYWRWVDNLQEKARDPEYCQSIEWRGNSALTAFSPGNRFMVYATPPIPQANALPHVEMRDLASPQRRQPKDFRRSWRSLEYCYKLRPETIRRDKSVQSWWQLWL